MCRVASSCIMHFRLSSFIFFLPPLHAPLTSCHALSAASTAIGSPVVPSVRPATWPIISPCVLQQFLTEVSTPCLGLLRVLCPPDLLLLAMGLMSHHFPILVLSVSILISLSSRMICLSSWKSIWSSALIVSPIS